jgi:hypothetical protein
MGVPISEVCYTSVTTGRGDHEVHGGHVVALDLKNIAVWTVEVPQQLHFEMLEHPLLTPDVAPSECHTFHSLRDA